MFSSDLSEAGCVQLCHFVVSIRSVSDGSVDGSYLLFLPHLCALRGVWMRAQRRTRWRTG